GLVSLDTSSLAAPAKCRAACRDKRNIQSDDDFCDEDPQPFRKPLVRERLRDEVEAPFEVDDARSAAPAPRTKHRGVSFPVDAVHLDALVGGERVRLRWCRRGHWPFLKAGLSRTSILRKKPQSARGRRRRRCRFQSPGQSTPGIARHFSQSFYGSAYGCRK